MASGLPTDHRRSRYPQTAAYLMGLGIDPRAVRSDDIGADGYDRIEMLPDGRRATTLIDGERRWVTERRPWPSLEVAATVMFSMAIEDLWREPTPKRYPEKVLIQHEAPSRFDDLTLRLRLGDYYAHAVRDPRPGAIVNIQTA